MEITYDVRVYKTEVYRGSRVTTYKVRWKAGDKTWKRPFRTAAQADVFRAELLAAARKGEAFSLATGEPVSWQRNQPGVTWYEFACAYVDSKWESASAKYRRAIAQALASATMAMLTGDRSMPDSQVLRSALVNWGFNTKQRAMAPAEQGDALIWLARNTREVKELADSILSRQTLMAATSRLDGNRAAPTSVHRNRAVLLNALDYAVELKLLDTNPIKDLKWRVPKVAHEVDRRVVVNPAQARALLEAAHSNPADHAWLPSSASSTTAGYGPRKQSASAARMSSCQRWPGKRIAAIGGSPTIHGVNSICGLPGPTQAVAGLMTDLDATVEDSSTEPKVRRGASRVRPS